MSNLAVVRIPKTGTVSLLTGMLPLMVSDQYPCVTNLHKTTDYFNRHPHDHDFITMVRDPLQQYISCYYFLKNRAHIAETGRHIHVDGRDGTLRTQRKAVEASTSLEDYLSNTVVGDFAERYFGKVAPESFMFVGETNQMEASIAVLSKMLNMPMQVHWENRNPKRPTTLQPYYVAPSVAAAFKARNASEYDLYERSVAHFNTLKATWLQ